MRCFDAAKAAQSLIHSPRSTVFPAVPSDTETFPESVELTGDAVRGSG